MTAMFDLQSVHSKTTEPAVWTFFYGSWINLNVLREMNYVPETWGSC